MLTWSSINPSCIMQKTFLNYAETFLDPANILPGSCNNSSSILQRPFVDPVEFPSGSCRNHSLIRKDLFWILKRCFLDSAEILFGSFRESSWIFQRPLRHCRDPFWIMQRHFLDPSETLSGSCGDPSWKFQHKINKHIIFYKKIQIPAVG